MKLKKYAANKTKLILRYHLLVLMVIKSMMSLNNSQCGFIIAYSFIALLGSTHSEINMAHKTMFKGLCSDSGVVLFNSLPEALAFVKNDVYFRSKAETS